MICYLCWKKVLDFHTFYTEIYNKHFDDSIKHEPNEHKEEPDLFLNDGHADQITHDTSDESDCAQRDPVFVSIPYNEIIDDIKDEDDVKDEENTSNLDNDDDFENVPLSLRKKIVKRPIVKLKKMVPSVEMDYSSSGDETDDDILSKISTVQRKKSKKTDLDETTSEYLEIIDKKITAHFMMECDLCRIKFTSYGNVKSHYRILHEVEGYLKCCEKKFFRPNSLIEHIEWHKTPEDFKCLVCEKSFTRKYTLHKHQENQHRPLTAPEKLPFECTICLKMYPSKMKLRRHTQVVHGERKFVCDKCGFRLELII